MRIASFAAMVLALTLLAGNSALACDCVTLSPNESLRNADVVFEGTLLGITSVRLASGESLAYTFKVDKSLKGPTTSTVMLDTLDSDCDASFKPQLIYRVYARDDGSGRLISSACAGNEILGTHYTYTSHASSSSFRLWYMPVFEIFGLGVLLGTSVFLWRKYVTKLP